MKKISVKKILVALLSLAITIYLIAVIASAVFMSLMTSLTYNATGFGVTLAEYQIDFEANTAERNYYNYDNTLSEHTECHYGKAIITILIFTMATSGIW